MISIIIFCSGENDFVFQVASGDSGNSQESDFFVPNDERERLSKRGGEAVRSPRPEEFCLCHPSISQGLSPQSLVFLIRKL